MSKPVARDPRISPKVGDKLKFPGGIMAIFRTVTAVKDGVVSYKFLDGRYRGESSAELDVWLKAAEKAKVIRRAE